MASQGLRLMKRFYHPQPVGWLVTLVVGRLAVGELAGA